MDWLQHNAEWVAAIIGAAVGAWTLASRFHRGIIEHFAAHFATKADLELVAVRLETKLDTALALRFKRLDHIESRSKPDAS